MLNAVYLQACVRACVCRGQSTIMDALFYCSVLFPQDRDSYSIWNSPVFVSLVDQHVPEIHPPLSPHWGYRCAWPHVGAGDLNPGPPAVQKVLSVTEPSPWPTAFISKN